MALVPQMHFLSDPERSIPHRRGRPGLNASPCPTQTLRLGSRVGPDQAAPYFLRWTLPLSPGRSDAKSFRRDEARASDDDREHGAELAMQVARFEAGLPKGEDRTGTYGIIAVRQRFAFKYGDRAALRLESTPTGTRAIVELPAQRMDPVPTAS